MMDIRTSSVAGEVIWLCRCAVLAIGICAVHHSAFAQWAVSPSPFAESMDAPDDASWPTLLPDAWQLTVLPDGLLYRSYLAGPKESRLDTQLVYEKDDGWLLDATVGGRVGLLRFTAPDGLSAFQVDVEGSAQLRQDPGEDYDIRSVDFRGGVPFTWARCNHQWKLAYYHISSHLGDEFVLKNPTFPRLNYVRDSVVLGYSWYPDPTVRLYGEAGYAFYTDVAQPWEFQFGTEYAPECPTGPAGAPFVAFNTLLREEVDFGGTVTLQAGWAWRGDTPAGRLLRVGLLYQGGKSAQYSFVNTSEQQIGAGIWYDY